MFIVCLHKPSRFRTRVCSASSRKARAYLRAGKSAAGWGGKGTRHRAAQQAQPTSWEEERYEATASEVGGGRGGGGSKRTSVSAQPPPHRPHPVRIPQIRVSAVVLRVSGPGRSSREAHGARRGAGRVAEMLKKNNWVLPFGYIYFRERIKCSRIGWLNRFPAGRLRERLFSLSLKN